MRIKPLLILIFVLFILLGSQVFAQKQKKPVKHRKSSTVLKTLTDTDKKQIIEYIFKDGFSNFHSIVENFSIPKSCADAKEKTTLISTENLDPAFVPSIENYNFDFLTSQTLIDEALENKPVCYWEISQMSLNRNTVFVRFGFVYRKLSYINAKYLLYDFKKRKNVWKGKYLGWRTLES